MPKSVFAGNSTASKGSSLITMEDENGWVLIQLRNSCTNIEETNEEIQTVLSDYVVVTLEDVSKCGERDGSTKAEKAKPFLKIPAKRFCMSHPRYFVPKQSNKTGKVKTHCLSIQRLKPYLRTRLDYHHDKLQNTPTTRPHKNYQETLSTLQKSLSVLYGAIENKEGKISTLALKLSQPRAMEEKRFLECSLTLNDLYFVSTYCKLRTLLGDGDAGFSSDSGMVLPHKLFIRRKANNVLLCPYSRFDPFAKGLQFPRQHTYSTETKIKMCDNKWSSLSFRNTNDHGTPLKSSPNGINIYEDIVKALKSNRSYYTRVFLKEVTAGDHHEQDNTSSLKFVRKDSVTVVGKEPSPAVINVIVDKLTLANIMEKEKARDKFNGVTIATTYGGVGLSFVSSDNEGSSTICLKAVPATTSIYEDVVKTFKYTCMGNAVAASKISVSSRVMKTMDDQVFLSRLPSLPLEVEPPKSKFSTFLSRPKPLFVDLKGTNQMTVMSKGVAWYDKMVASTFSCLPQHLTMFSQLPGPAVLFWLLGCHILAVLRSYQGLCSSTTETQARYVTHLVGNE